jgi:hypothetical protein
MQKEVLMRGEIEERLRLEALPAGAPAPDALWRAGDPEEDEEEEEEEEERRRAPSEEEEEDEEGWEDEEEEEELQVRRA